MLEQGLLVQPSGKVDDASSMPCRAGTIPNTFGALNELMALSNNPSIKMSTKKAELYDSGQYRRLARIVFTGLVLANNSFSGVVPATLLNRYVPLVPT